MAEDVMLSETTFLVILIGLVLAMGFLALVSECRVALQMVDYDRPPRTIAMYKMYYPSILNKIFFFRRFRVSKRKRMMDHSAERWYVTDCYRDNSPLKVTGRDTYFVAFNHGRERIVMEVPDGHWPKAWKHVARRLEWQFNVFITIPRIMDMTNPRRVPICIEERRELFNLE
jgi:hypothetical protein